MLISRHMAEADVSAALPMRFRLRLVGGRDHVAAPTAQRSAA
jgi:hypothetical protein